MVYNISNDNHKYYLCDLYNNSYNTFNSIKSLLIAVSNFNYDNTKKLNSILENLALNQNDKIYSFNYKGEIDLTNRRYIVYEDWEKIINLNLYKDLLFNDNFLKNIKSVPFKHHKYKFRKEPVPFTGKTPEYFKTKLPSLIRQEIKNSLKVPTEFVRKKRFSMIKHSYWDNSDNYYRVCSEKSWKYQRKSRHQWKDKKKSS